MNDTTSAVEHQCPDCECDYVDFSQHCSHCFELVAKRAIEEADAITADERCELDMARAERERLNAEIERLKKEIADHLHNLAAGLDIANGLRVDIERLKAEAEELAATVERLRGELEATNAGHGRDYIGGLLAGRAEVIEAVLKWTVYRPEEALYLKGRFRERGWME